MRRVIAIVLILSFCIIPLSLGCSKNNSNNGPTATHQANSNSESPSVEGTKNKLTIGAFYYPWYGKDKHWDEGYLRNQLQPAQEPYLGEYDCSDPKVSEQHIKWAKEYGIDYFITSWWGPSGVEDANIRNSLLKAPNASDIKFGILYETTGRFGGDFDFNPRTEQILKKDMEYLATNYFGLSNYLKFEGKPVIYFYLSRLFTGDYIGVMNNIRSHIKSKFGYDLFVIGDEVFWDGYPSEEKLGIMDAISIYNIHGGPTTNGYPGKSDFKNIVGDMFETSLTYAQNNKKYFIPNILPGFNDRGVRPEAFHVPIPREFNPGEEGKETTLSECLEIAYKYRDPELNTILVTSWNEWHEDTQVEPTKISSGKTNKPEDLTKGYSYPSYGFKDLEIIKEFKEKYLR